MDIREFAQREGISVQRAAKLARDGRIQAVKRGRSWNVAPDATLVRRGRRPLSPRSQEDFIQFLDSGTLDHVTGDRKRRTASRVQQYWSSDNPAQLLREWFAGTRLEGRGGRALIRAAQVGHDDQVAEVRAAKGAWILKDKDSIRGRISDYAAIRGLNSEEVAQRSGVNIDTVNALLRRGYSVSGNLDAHRVVRTLEIPAVLVDAVLET